MGNVAPRDDNFVPALIATLNTDGKTIVPIKANPTTNFLKVSNGSSGSDNGPKVAPHDANMVPALLATSSTDGKSPVVVYADSNGNLLINFN